MSKTTEDSSGCVAQSSAAVAKAPISGSQVLREYRVAGSILVQVVRGDMCDESVDAIVSPTGNFSFGPHSLSGAIVQRGTAPAPFPVFLRLILNGRASPGSLASRW